MIEGISERPTELLTQRIPSVIGFDIPAEVAVNVELIKTLRRLDDEDAVTESLTRDFTELVKNNPIHNPNSRLYVRPVFDSTLGFKNMVAAVNGERADGSYRYSATEVPEELWTKISAYDNIEPFLHDDYNRMSLSNDPNYQLKKWIACLAIVSNDPEDSLVHFTGKAYDDMHCRIGEKSQLETLPIYREGYESKDEHSECYLTTANFANIAALAILARIKDEPLPFAPYQYTRLPDLGRKLIDHSRWIGCVGAIARSRLVCDYREGYDDDHRGLDGIGLAAVLKRDIALVNNSVLIDS